jgi:hypothetical protein
MRLANLDGLRAEVARAKRASAAVHYDRIGVARTRQPPVRLLQVACLGDVDQQHVRNLLVGLQVVRYCRMGHV